MKTLFLILSLLFGIQDQGRQGIPDDVYYLMPSFSQGIIYFTGQGPAQGQLNICALDNSLRFLDKSGKELSATNAENIIMVRIDTVTFLRANDSFYRLYPVSANTGVAVLREVKITRNAKPGAYGTTSQTSSTREYGTIYSDGAIYNLNDDREVPYEVSNVLFIYKGQDVYPLNKKNLRKFFPEIRDAIDAYFSAGNTVPDTVEEALKLLKAEN